MSAAPRARTSPLRATVPLACATKQGSGLRSPGAAIAGPRAPPRGGSIRRTASLDAIYLRGLFPRESLFWHRDRATQTDRAGSLDSLQVLDGVEERMARLAVRQRRRSCSREDKGEGTAMRNPPSPNSRNSASVPPKSSRNSEEGLNQELELYASVEPLVCDRLQEPVPEGRKAPVAELIRERPFSRTRQSANHNSSGLCYAEFAARVPRAGSAYVYSYVSVGEIVAYVIGWNLILEYAIGTASVARGLSGYIDALADHQIKEGMESWARMHVGFLASYPDFMAFGFVMLLTALLSIGVKESSRLNNVFTALNLTTIAIVIVSGAIKADPANWKKSVPEIPEEFREGAGEGGFMPFGVSGIMAGAAQCFYGFVGFDAVATTGEEAKNPQRNIPLAIVISLIIIFLAYFGISTVLTMMWPYYDQDATAPFPYVFENLGWTAIKWIVTIGAVIALCTSLLGAMFPLPRVIYAMANDGLIFKLFAKIHPKTKTPVVATILSGLLVGCMAILFDTDQLINMMSIGTLLAYTIVAVCVLILRYQPVEKEYPDIELKKEEDYTFYGMFRQLFNLNMNKYASSTSTKITNWSIIIFAIFAAGFDAFIIYAIDILDRPYIMTIFIIVTVVMLSLIVVIARQPADDFTLSFKVPWVPFIPCLSIIINLYLMLELDKDTWIRFAAWMFVGFLIYFFYGITNSVEKKFRKDVQLKKEAAQNSNKAMTKF